MYRIPFIFSVAGGQPFDPVTTSAAEKIQRSPVWIHVQPVLHDRAEAVNGSPHVGVAADNIKLIRGRDIA